MKLRVPVCSVLIYDFPEYVLQRLVCGFGQSVRMWVVRRTALMDYHIECCETLHDLAVVLCRSAFASTHFVKYSVATMMYLFPVRIVGGLNGPTKSNPHFWNGSNGDTR